MQGKSPACWLPILEMEGAEDLRPSQRQDKCGSLAQAADHQRAGGTDPAAESLRRGLLHGYKTVLSFRGNLCPRCWAIPARTATDRKAWKNTITNIWLAMPARFWPRWTPTGGRLPGASRPIDPQPGLNLVLTTDAFIQSFWNPPPGRPWRSTKAKSVCAIVMNPKTAIFWAWSIIPRPNLNNLDRSDLQALANLSEHSHCGRL